jgi:hypothetical protein
MQHSLNDDLLALTVSYLDITDYKTEEINSLILSLGCDSPNQVLSRWDKSSRHETIIEGTKITRKVNGKIHCANGPAILFRGSKAWYVNGRCHRVDGPAIDWLNGTKQWWVDGKLHRIDGPAVERSDGTKQWWMNDNLHRVDGPAVEYADGTRMWWVNGNFDREEGPDWK